MKEKEIKKEIEEIKQEVGTIKVEAELVEVPSEYVPMIKLEDGSVVNQLQFLVKMYNKLLRIEKAVA